MKRRLDCALCGRALPAGCRIDKRYCDQRCVELAYYERHPEKRAQKLNKLRGARADARPQVKRLDGTPELLERVEAAHASTHRELGAFGERLAQMEALLRGRQRAGSEPQVPSTSEREAAALRQVSELQMALQSERRRADYAEQEKSLALDAARRAERRSQEWEAECNQARAAARRTMWMEPDETLTSAREAADKRIAELEAELKDVRRRASEAEHGKKESDGKIAGLQRDVESWRVRCEKQTIPSSAVQTDAPRVRELEDKLATMTQRAQQADEARRKSEDRLKEQQREIDAARREVAANARKPGDADEPLRSRVSDLESKLQVTADRAAASARACQAAEATVAELRGQLHDARARSEEQARQLVAAQQSLQAAEMRVQRMKLADELPIPWPWMKPDPQDPRRYVPRWAPLKPSTQQTLEELAEQMIADAPSHYWIMGARSLSKDLRAWMETPSPVLRPLSRQLILRITYTSRSLRSEEPQIETLADSALADSMRQLQRQQPALSDELARAASESWQYYAVLARTFVTLCDGVSFERTG